MEPRESRGTHSVVLGCFSGVLSAGLSLVAKMSCSLRVHLSVSQQALGQI